MIRATKIVATLGPASSSPETLERMLAAGTNVVRVNFSHGSAAEHTATVRLVREIAQRLGRDIGVLADLQGPKIRVGKFVDGRITLAVGDRFTFDIECELGDQQRVGLDYKELVDDVRVGDTLLLCSDGLSGPVSDAEIAEILGKYSDIKVAAAKLIERANENGGPDNITSVLVKWQPKAA